MFARWTTRSGHSSVLVESIVRALIKSVRFSKVVNCSIRKASSVWKHIENISNGLFRNKPTKTSPCTPKLALSMCSANIVEVITGECTVFLAQAKVNCPETEECGLHMCFSFSSRDDGSASRSQRQLSPTVDTDASHQCSFLKAFNGLAPRLHHSLFRFQTAMEICFILQGGLLFCCSSVAAPMFNVVPPLQHNVLTLLGGKG